MAITVHPEQFLRFAHRPAAAYVAAFADVQSVLDRYGISAGRLRLAHFAAQILHETGGLSIEQEDLSYRAQRLAQVWPSRFQPSGPLDPQGYAHNPEKLANEVYGKRMGNSAPGDGYAYRGRGLLQLTGKDSYASATLTLRKSEPDSPDFAADPDQVLAARWSLAVAAAEWESKGCNHFADYDNLHRVTRAINGGTIGLSSRAAWLRLTKRYFCRRPGRASCYS